MIYVYRCINIYTYGYIFAVFKWADVNALGCTVRQFKYFSKIVLREIVSRYLDFGIMAFEEIVPPLRYWWIFSGQRMSVLTAASFNVIHLIASAQLRRTIRDLTQTLRTRKSRKPSAAATTNSARALEDDGVAGLQIFFLSWTSSWRNVSDNRERALLGPTCP